VRMKGQAKVKMVVAVLAFLSSVIAIVGFAGFPTAHSVINAVRSLPAAVNNEVHSPQSASSQGLLPPGSAPELSLTEVRSWCTPINRLGTCEVSRFERYIRPDGTVIPSGVIMKGAPAVTIRIPSGFSAEVWDCYTDLPMVRGPWEGKVCQMKAFRGPVPLS
jgi:hypothetical protein